MGLPWDLAAAPFTPVEGIGTANEKTYPAPVADGVSIDRVSQVILVRTQGTIFAFSMTCPHQNAAVKWLEKDARFQCSKHDSKYKPDGAYTSGRATRNMDRFPIRRDGANVVVTIDRTFHSDTDAAGWAAAAVPAS